MMEGNSDGQLQRHLESANGVRRYCAGKGLHPAWPWVEQEESAVVVGGASAVCSYKLIWEHVFMEQLSNFHWDAVMKL